MARWRNYRDAGHLYFGSLCLLAFCIPVFKYGIQIPILLLILSWIISPKLARREQILPAAIFSLIYFFHLLGMLYTENLERGYSDLIQKFSLILFPVVLGTGPHCDRPQRRTLMRFFTLGTITAVAVGFTTSFYMYADSGSSSEFYMSNFSPVHHPSYLAYYVVFALIFLFSEIELSGNTKKTIPLWITVFFLSLTLIFPASKMGFITLVLILTVYFLRWMITIPRRVKSALMLLLIGASFGLSLKFDPVAAERVKKAVEVTAEADEAKPKSQVESTAARIHAWETSFELIRENPFGYGTGDVTDVLTNAYKQKGLDELAESELNPHNEFLQISLAQGVPVLIVFLFSLLFPFRSILRKRDWLYGLFLLITVSHFMVESMLEKQSGVIFFAFFNALLFFSAGDNDSHAP